MKSGEPTVPPKSQDPTYAAALRALQELNRRDAELADEETRLQARVRAAQSARLASEQPEARAAASLEAGRAIAAGGAIATTPVEVRLAATREARRLLRFPILEAHEKLVAAEDALKAREIARLAPAIRAAAREVSEAAEIVQRARGRLMSYPAALRAAGFQVFDADLFSGIGL